MTPSRDTLCQDPISSFGMVSTFDIVSLIDSILVKQLVIGKNNKDYNMPFCWRNFLQMVMMPLKMLELLHNFPCFY